MIESIQTSGRGPSLKPAAVMGGVILVVVGLGVWKATSTGKSATETRMVPTWARGVYATVGDMKATNDDSGGVRRVMRRAAMDALGEVPDVTQRWDDGRVPTKSELAERRYIGIYLNASLNNVESASGKVTCAVSMTVGTLPPNPITKTLDTSLSVEGKVEESGTGTKMTLDEGTMGKKDERAEPDDPIEKCAFRAVRALVRQAAPLLSAK